MREQKALNLRALNHISRVCRDVASSAAFYRDVLGFSQIKRPSSFEFEGAWLFNYGVGIHLIAGTPIPRSREINPKSDHLSFQVDCLDEVEQQLSNMGMEYVRNTIEEAGVMVTQLFFHDPDNNMIEICNCDLIPVVPLDSELVCTSCMSASFSLGTAVSMPSRRLSRGLSDCVEVPEPSCSHSHSSSSSTDFMIDSFRDSFRCSDDEGPSSASLFTALIQESTPHTGIRIAGSAGLRRACSMTFAPASTPLMSKEFGSMRVAQ